MVRDILRLEMQRMRLSDVIQVCYNFLRHLRTKPSDDQYVQLRLKRLQFEVENRSSISLASSYLSAAL